MMRSATSGRSSRSLHNRSIFAASGKDGSTFREKGLGATWIKNDVSEDEGDEILSDILEMFYNDTEEDEMEETGDMDETVEQEIENGDHTMSVNESNLTTPLVGNNSNFEQGKSGNFITDHFVFALEVVSDLQFRLVLATIYIFFITVVALENTLEFQNLHNFYPVAVRPENARGDEKLCYYDCDGKCSHTPADYTSLNFATVKQADLLVNTVIVSDGINASDWTGNGAKPGSPPFSAHDISQTFMNFPSSLNYDANPTLHSFWDDIVAVGWIGLGHHDLKIRSYTPSIQFKKCNGEWPTNITDQPLPIYSDFFTCVKGGNNFCDNIGNWRITGRRNQSKGTRVKLRGDTLSVSIYNDDYDYVVDESVVNNIGVRYALRADPSGVISDCLQGRNCVVTLLLEGNKSFEKSVVVATLSFTIIYFIFFIWWIFTLRKRRGEPRMWPQENWWLVLGGVGMILRYSFLRFALYLEAYGVSNVFHQKAWAASFIISYFGTCCFLYCCTCFIDSPRRFVVKKVTFHKYKIIYFTLLFMFTIITVLYIFPQAIGQDQPGTDIEIGGIGFGTDYRLWSNHDQVLASVASVSGTTLVIFGYFYYAWKSYRGFRVLNNIPFGLTRPTQLSFRFFFWATWLLMMIRMINTIRSIVIFQGDLMLEIRSLVAFDNNNTIFTGTFRFAFIAMMQILFLPPSADKVTSKSKTYHRSEDDAKHHRSSELSEGKYLLVLQRAKMLCECSRQAYLPLSPEELSKDNALVKEWKDKQDRCEGDSDMSSPLQKSLVPTCLINAQLHLLARDTEGGNRTSLVSTGCHAVAVIREAGNVDLHGTRVVVFRHESSGDLILSFRGTKTGKQVWTDLMMRKINVCLDDFLAHPHTKDGQTTNASHIEDMLTKGEITKVRLLDLLPKSGEELPIYLKDARKSGHNVSGIGQIHFGFWSSYNRVRRQIHSIVREELLARPGRLLLTGHSLGGCQATLCAYDMSRWVLPTVKRQMISLHAYNRAQLDSLQISCYTFGSPRVGGPSFAHAFKQVVPDAQRVVCDGDVITSGPPVYWGYYHVHHENIIDFTGTIRVEPSLIEKELSLKKRNNPRSHKINSYVDVVKKSFSPHVSEEGLLGLLKKKYGLKEE